MLAVTRARPAAAGRRVSDRRERDERRVADRSGLQRRIRTAETPHPWFPRPATRARADLGAARHLARRKPGRDVQYSLIVNYGLSPLVPSSRRRCFPPAYRVSGDVAPHGGAGPYNGDQRGYPDQ